MKIILRLENNTINQQSVNISRFKKHYYFQNYYKIPKSILLKIDIINILFRQFFVISNENTENVMKITYSFVQSR